MDSCRLYVLAKGRVDKNPLRRPFLVDQKTRSGYGGFLFSSGLFVGSFFLFFFFIWQCKCVGKIGWGAGEDTICKEAKKKEKDCASETSQVA